MTLQEALTLAVFSVLIGFMFGCWLSTPFTRFVMRRNRALQEENNSLKSRSVTYTITLRPGQKLSYDGEHFGVEDDDADWWKKK